MRENNDKKKYQAPLVSVIEVEMEDVIASSEKEDYGLDDGGDMADPGQKESSSSYRTTFPGQ